MLAPLWYFDKELIKVTFHHFYFAAANLVPPVKDQPEDGKYIRERETEIRLVIGIPLYMETANFHA